MVDVRDRRSQLHESIPATHAHIVCAIELPLIASFATLLATTRHPRCVRPGFAAADDSLRAAYSRL